MSDDWSNTPGKIVEVHTDRLEDQVLHFMKTAGQLVELGFPEFFSESRQNRWKMLMGEGKLGAGGELTEYMEAEAHDDLPEVVDGLVDMMWVIMGTLYTYVGDQCARDLMQEVARANISKINGSLAPMEKDDNGKVIKPEGWTPPDIRGVLEMHGWKLDAKGKPLHD